MKFIKSAFNYIYVILMGYLILLVSIFNKLSNLWALAAGAAVLFLLCIIVRAKNSSGINYRRLWWVVLLTFPILLVIVSLSLQVDPLQNWDFAKLYTTAYESVHHKTLINDYYAQYPNNLFWVSCLIALYKFLELIFGTITFENFALICLVCSCLCVYISVIFIHKTARIVWDDRRAFYVGLGACGFLPLYLYAQYFYTDTSALLIVSIFIYVYFKIRTVGSTKQYILATVLGLLASLIFKVKVLSFIIPFAFLLDSFTKIFNKKKYFICLTIAFAVAAGSFFMFQGVDNCYVKISNAKQNKCEFPSTHWVMMGLNKEIDGGYLQSDVDYTNSYSPKEAKKKANLEKIKERIDKMGFGGTVYQVMIRKSYRTWSEGCLDGRGYASRNPVHPNNIVHNILSDKGKYHIVSYVYSNIYYFIILIGMFISAIAAIKKKRYELNALRISIIGIIVFMWGWECNPRYLFTFIPAMLLLGADGLGELLDFAKRRRK